MVVERVEKIGTTFFIEKGGQWRMGFFSKLLKGFTQPAMPERRTEIKTGHFWQVPGTLPLAAGRGYNQQVVGESFYRADLERIVGGRTVLGVNVSVVAELLEGVYEGRPTVGVFIEGVKCGNIPKEDVADLVQELRLLETTGLPIVAKARISAGFEGGDYSVAVSMARPLRPLP